jgi:hypothetical protein
MLNFFLGKYTDVTFGLGNRRIDGILMASGGQFFASLLPFENEAVPAIQIDVPVIGIDIDSRRRNKSLKHAAGRLSVKRGPTPIRR